MDGLPGPAADPLQEGGHRVCALGWNHVAAAACASDRGVQGQGGGAGDAHIAEGGGGGHQPHCCLPCVHHGSMVEPCGGGAGDHAHPSDRADEGCARAQVHCQGTGLGINGFHGIRGGEDS